jgi:outer membrane immunogenic protein
MAYVAGGYTEARFGEINPLTFAFGGAVAATFLPATTYKGWFIGTGYEYALGWFPGLYWKTEYRFADYRSEDVFFTTVATGVRTGDYITSHKYIQTIRSELVYRFNWGGGGVVARY